MSLAAAVGARAGSLRLQVDLEVAAGETVAVLGPNGAGKTTLLRVLAGLQPLEQGRVVLDGELLEEAGGRRLPPERRRVGVVFQDYLLFPHLSALANVAYPLRARGLPGREAERQAAALLERVGLRGEGGRRPGALSGGQRQRVAIARALAGEPRLLLLDEPLAALDVANRAATRRLLREALAGFPGTRLLVTHDPLDALLLAARVVVLEEGRVVQAGTPEDLVARPASAFAADLAGMNFYRGRAEGGVVELVGGGRLVAAAAPAGEVAVTVHPRSVSLFSTRPQGSPRNVWQGRVRAVELAGERARVRLIGPPDIVAEVTPPAVRDLGLVEGESVWVAVKASEVTAYPG